MSDEAERVRNELLAESQEIVEALSRDLLLLDHGQKTGHGDPELINSVFRAIHTLKGIAGMFGSVELTQVAHLLEDLLDQLRLGRVALAQETLDVLFEGVEVLQRMLGSVRGESHSVDIEGLRTAVHGLLGASSTTREDPLDAYDLGPELLGVLTEYEEHRLRTNAQQRVPLYRLRVRFPLASIDTDLDAVKRRLKPVAEIITYLPSIEGSGDDTIELDVLLASRSSAADLRSLAGSDSLEPIAARAAKTSSPPLPEARIVQPHSAPPEPSPAPIRDVGAEGLAVRAVSKTVRVDIAKLDHLMNLVGELGILRSTVSRVVDRLGERRELRPLATELQRVHRSFERHLSALQDGLLDVRMVPIGQTFERLARAVRQVAREHGKDVRLVVNGGDTEVDKLIVEELIDPLLHIIRNAVGHGTEMPEERRRLGKDPTAVVAFNAYQKGNHVVIEVEDDGAGIDTARVLARAVERGLVSKEVAGDLDDHEIRELVFLPGFTTAEAVTDLSGRGVGLDVVRTNIARLGGVIDLHSTVGVGTKFTLTLPITLAIMNSLVMRVAGQTFAIPLTVVQEALSLADHPVGVVDGRELITLRGQSLPIVRLGQLFQLTRERLNTGFVVVTALGQRRVGFVVDALEGQQDIVTKPLGESLRNVRGFSGATDLGDQRVVLVLDAPSLLDEALSAEGRFLVGAA